VILGLEVESKWSGSLREKIWNSLFKIVAWIFKRKDLGDKVADWKYYFLS